MPVKLKYRAMSRLSSAAAHILAGQFPELCSVAVVHLGGGGDNTAFEAGRQWVLRVSRATRAVRGEVNRVERAELGRMQYTRGVQPASGTMAGRDGRNTRDSSASLCR